MLSHHDAILLHHVDDAAAAAAFGRGMERLARPWRARRALAVWREPLDGTAPPPTLATAMASAEWLVLVASPSSAASDAVGIALRKWIAEKGTRGLLVVVTDGSWVWDGARGDLDLTTSTAVHPALIGAFAAEPRHMDLGWARSADERSLRNVAYRESVAEVVAPMHGRTKDEMVGEDVRLQVRTRRRVRATSAVLAVLTMFALGATGVAVASAQEAERQRERAEQERTRAEEQERIAQDERARADEQTAQADSRRLAALSQGLQSEDGALARLLAVQAYRTADTPEAVAAVERAALLEGTAVVADDDGVVGLQAGAVEARLIGHDPRPVAAAFAAERDLLVTVDGEGAVRYWDTADPESATLIGGTDGVDVAVAADGETVAVATGGDVRMLDAAGEVVAAVAEPAQRVAVLGDRFVVATTRGTVLVVDAEGQVVVEPIDLETTALATSADGATVVATVGDQIVRLDAELTEVARWDRDAPAYMGGGIGASNDVLAVSADGTQVVLADTSFPENGPTGTRLVVAAVHDAATGERLEQVVQRNGYVGLPASAAAVLPDGGVVAVSSGGPDGAPPDLGTSGGADAFGEFPLPASADLVRTSPDGRLLLVAGDEGAAVLARAEGAEPADDTTSGDATDGDATADGDTGALVEQACRLAGRNFTGVEWARYLPDADYQTTCAAYDAPHVPPALDAELVLAEDGGEGADLAGDDDALAVDDEADEAAVDLADPFAGIDFANSRYQVPCGGEVAQLVDGTWSSGTRRITGFRVEQLDMDGDGITDAVVGLTCTDGNGLSTGLSAFSGADGQALTPIGSPVSGQVAMTSEPGVLRTASPVYADADPQCCPSTYDVVEWELLDGDWVEARRLQQATAEVVPQPLPPPPADQG